MTAKPAPRPPQKFDLAKFETMVEPFNVRVEKLKGTTKYEIPLPEQDGSAPGTGWSKDQVREMQTWIVKEWAGGGHYFFAVVDAQGQTMEWNAYYSPSEFAERVPPTLASAYGAGAIPFIGQSTPVNQKVQMASFPTSGSNLPPASAYPGAPMMPAAVPMPAPAPQYAQPWPAYPGYGYPGMPQPAPSNEAQALREQLAQERQLAAQRDFERRLETMKAESEQKMAALQAQFSSMIDKLGEKLVASRPAGPDPAIVQMQEQNRLLQEQLRRQTEDNERARREAELREQITRSTEETRRLVDEANRRSEAMMRDLSSAKGPDQQLLMFQTMFNSQSEAMKEIARNSQSQIERMQANALRPQDILAIAKDASSSTDQVAANITRQFEAMFSIQRQLIEQAANLNQGGGNEVIGLVRDGAGKLSEMAEKYLGQKSKEQIAHVNAQAVVAQSQAEVQRATQERLTEMARMEAALRSGQIVQMPDGTFRAPAGAPQAAIPGANGTSGGTVVTPPTPAWVPPHMRQPKAQPSSGLSGAPAEAPTAPPDNVVPFKPDGSPNNPRKIKGRTDMEWFGPILPNVNELRGEVAKFLAGLAQVPPVKDGATPAECASAINIAAGQIIDRQIPIPAMIDLLLQGMLADFIDVLLPEATQPYRDEVVKLLAADDEEEENEDNGGDDGGDEDEQQPQAGA